jgi:hypothetical protein
MKSLLTSASASFRRPSGRRAVLQVAGFGAISFALGMWLLPVGIAAAGLALLIMAGLTE